MADQVGTTQMELSSGGWPVWEGAFTPFGQEIIGGTTQTQMIQPETPDSTNMHYKFTGKQRDAESGLDYLGARYYASNMGRFMSPDWSASPAAVPYASLSNPQSLNLYTYVNNNPLRAFDPDGHAGHSTTPPPPDSSGSPALLQMGGASLFALMDAAVAANEEWDDEQKANASAQQQNGQQGINNSLKYKTVTGGQKQGPWEINWSLTHNTKKGGFIVQHIVADFGDAGHYDYYEAWPVAPNSHTPSIQGVDGNGNLYSDMFSGPAGSHIHGSARFYKGLNLPDHSQFIRQVSRLAFCVQPPQIRTFRQITPRPQMSVGGESPDPRRNEDT